MPRPFSPAIAMLLMTAAGGCFDAEPPSLISRHAPQKIPAIKAATENHDEKAVPQLVVDLDSDDSAVRFYAIEGLRRLTGQDFGYVYYQDALQRHDAVMKWRQWLNDQSHSEQPATQTAGGEK